MTGQTMRALPSKSLLGSIRDGSAGLGTKTLVSLAGTLILLAFSSILAYALAALLPSMFASGSGGSYYGPGVYVGAQAVTVSFAIGALLFLAMQFWIWSRYGRSRGVWVGAGATVGIWVVTIPLCVLIAAGSRDDYPFLVGGIVCASAGATILLWLRLYRRYAGGRAIWDKTGVMDLRCPECQYRMVGLKESRCPECGREYTLDELLSRQDFDVLRGGRDAEQEQSATADLAPTVAPRKL